VLAGRHLEIQLGTSKTTRNRKFRILGLLEAFSNTSACEAGQPINIQRRSLSSLRYTTVETVKTGATGHFSIRLTATTSAVYRGWVDQTSQCLGTVSETQKLTVTRPSRRH
jgi:hypothetical protein